LVSKMRIQRIADRIREELSEIMLKEVQDPRLEGISITDVTVDRELAFADIFVSAVEGSARAEEVLQGLRHAGGYLRSELAKRVELRTFPRLRFHWDPTPERAEHIEQLLDSLQAETSSEQNGETTPKDERGIADE
jgi:ribosome-binding factor A